MTGVPQGSILGFSLFLLEFNGVVDAIEHCSILKYADDTVLYPRNMGIQSFIVTLSRGKDCLADGLKNKELVLNLKEGKIVSFHFGILQRVAKLEVKILHQTVIFNTIEYNSNRCSNR